MPEHAQRQQKPKQEHRYQVHNSNVNTNQVSSPDDLQRAMENIQSGDRSPETIMQLQRTIGNHATQQILNRTSTPIQRKPPSATSSALTSTLNLFSIQRVMATNDFTTDARNTQNPALDVTSIVDALTEWHNVEGGGDATAQFNALKNLKARIEEWKAANGGNPFMTTVDQVETQVNNELPAIVGAHIQAAYGIQLDDPNAAPDANPLGKAATEDTYSAELAGGHVLPAMGAKDFTLSELLGLEETLKLYGPLLGAQRDVGALGAQPINSFSRFDEGIEGVGGAGAGVVLDPDTAGETFTGLGNISMYDASTVPGDHATSEQEFAGVTAHELSHILIEETRIQSAANPAEDKKIVSEFYRATGFFDSRYSSPYWRDDTPGGGAPTNNFDFGDVNYVNNTRAAATAANVEAPITAYGMEDANEDLADTMSFFRSNPARLRADAPTRYQFIIDHVAPLLDPMMVWNARTQAGENIPPPAPAAPPVPQLQGGGNVNGGGGITPEALREGRNNLTTAQPAWTGAAVAGGNANGGGIQIGGNRGQGGGIQIGGNRGQGGANANGGGNQIGANPAQGGANANGGNQIGANPAQGGANANGGVQIGANPAQNNGGGNIVKKAKREIKKAFKKLFG